jgi:drug/metabolite transporter (DMT)-like permease
MKLRAYLLMLAVVAVWGSTFVIVKAALSDSTPAAFNMVRMILAFAVLAVAYRGAWRQIRRSQIAAGALVGLLMALGYQFQTVGLARTTPSKSAFITGLLVVMVPIFSLIPGLHPHGSRRPGWNAFAGAFIALAGIVLLTTPASTGTTGLSALLPDFSSINLGDVLTFGGAIAFALHCISLAHTSPRIGFRPLALMQVGFCALFMTVTMPLIEHPVIHWTPRLVGALVICAVLATSAAYSIQTWAQSVLPPTHTALILTMEPVFAWLTSFLFFGERLGLRPASGALLILAGILMTELLSPPSTPSSHEA